MFSLENMEKDAWWIIFYITILPASYWFVRSFLYKTMKSIFGDEFLYSNPRFLLFTRFNAALKIFPPMHFNSEQRSKWDSTSWIYLPVLVLIIIAVHLVANVFF